MSSLTSHNYLQAHWDMPEKLLRAFMGDDAEV